MIYRQRMMITPPPPRKLLAQKIAAGKSVGPGLGKIEIELTVTIIKLKLGQLLQGHCCWNKFS